MSARDWSDSPFGDTCTPSLPTSTVTRRCSGRCSVPLGPLTITKPPETVTSVLAGMAIGLLASPDIYLPNFEQRFPADALRAGLCAGHDAFWSREHKKTVSVAHGADVAHTH